MPKKQYGVQLSTEDRADLSEIIEKGKHSAREIRRAQSLLLADEQRQDQAIAAFLQVDAKTIAATRQRDCEVGLPATLKEKPRPGKARQLDGKPEAFVLALACSATPDGRAEWTMQRLADRLVELKVVEGSSSDQTIRRTLKKTPSSPG
jgi:hypothetical protein